MSAQLPKIPFSGGRINHNYFPSEYPLRVILLPPDPWYYAYASGR
jgi:hypothetical protein